jgi:para-nitrobenzyl esterase
MSRAWLAMAHGSSPEHEGMPRWPRYDPEAARAVLHLDGHCHVVEDPLAAERQVWTGHI